MQLFFFADYSTQDYYTTSSETSTTLQAVEEEIEVENLPEIDDFLQQTPYVQQQSGSYYTGRVGLPTPVFNLDVRRKQPGPRFRNEMLLPKRFRGNFFNEMNLQTDSNLREHNSKRAIELRRD